MKQLVLLLAILTTSVCFGNTIHVPDDYSTITLAIQAASDGDTVQVAPGTYVVDAHISFAGKDILVVSEQGPEVTIVQGGFIFIPTDTVGAILDGFTLSYEDGPIVVCFFNSNPLIRNCIIRDGVSSDVAGAVMAASSSPRFENCTFTNNFAAAQGSAIFAARDEEAPPCNVEISGCRFISNLSTTYPGFGGIDIHASQGADVTVDNTLFVGDTISESSCIKVMDSHVTLNNCTISGHNFINCEVENDSTFGCLTLNNCIVNHGEGLAFLISLPEDSLVVTHCLVYGYGPKLPDSTFVIDEYINAYPIFCDTTVFDYHISDTSPAVPENNQWGELIGAFGPDCHIPYLCGDADANWSISIGDVVFIIAYIFSPDAEAPSPLAAANADCSPTVNLSDAIYIIGYIFGATPAPCDPDGDGEPDC